MAKAEADKPKTTTGRKPKADKPKARAAPRARKAAAPKPKVKAASNGPKVKRGPQMKDAPPIETPTVDKLAKDEVEALIKRYRGRPTKYDPAFCDMVILWGRLGKSKAWMCGELMVARSTVDTWLAEHEEFHYAMELAQHLAQIWWEDKGQDNLTTTGFQGSVYSRSMAARFPQDWTERRDTNVNLTSQEDWLKKLASAEASGELV